ncbi:transcriptional regulator BetI [Mesorhizobium sp. AR07]|uniref:transcriptional regulator BetI n=1 Tax=Mesorhizobium sp. AR07 TaxID=2865838 RepID=UPI00216005D6|nr:transcriptional regulator BetI [Mesorhizobium sp. AR07]UVK43965.1 transcriptional regulator BetI [Mesorhizobium sp. AR07]
MESAPRTKTRIEDIRRVELIEAAHRVFLNGGLNGLTTTRICQEAGMSQGILTYYFKNKDEVLFEMVRYANRILMDNVVMRLRQAKTNWERLIAIIEGNFPEASYNANTANAWVSFYAAAAANARYAMLQRLFYRRLRSNLSSALNSVLTPNGVDRFAQGFAALIDGLWLRRGHSEDLTAAEAISLLTEYAERTLGAKIVNKLRKPSAERL